MPSHDQHAALAKRVEAAIKAARKAVARARLTVEQSHRIAPRELRLVAKWDRLEARRRILVAEAQSFSGDEQARNQLAMRIALYYRDLGALERAVQEFEREFALAGAVHP